MKFKLKKRKRGIKAVVEQEVVFGGGGGGTGRGVRPVGFLPDRLKVQPSHVTERQGLWNGQDVGRHRPRVQVLWLTRRKTNASYEDSGRRSHCARRRTRRSSPTWGTRVLTPHPLWHSDAGQTCPTAVTVYSWPPPPARPQVPKLTDRLTFSWGSQSRFLSRLVVNMDSRRLMTRFLSPVCHRLASSYLSKSAKHESQETKTTVRGRTGSPRKQFWKLNHKTKRFT